MGGIESPGRPLEWRPVLLQRRSADPAPTRPVARDPQPPVAEDPVEALRALGSSVGNRGLARALLRDPKADPAPRTTPGWTGADTTPGVVDPSDQVADPTAVEGGWNAAAAQVGDMWRVPVDGVPGTKSDFEGVERAKTTESAAGRAIVIVHKDIDPKRPVSVLLHLHGFGHRSQDPYAGWRQFTSEVPKGAKGKGPRAGTVRDVAHDRIEAQMTAVKNPQLIGILPQGAGGSRFGGIEGNPDAYVTKVLTRAVDVLKGTKVLAEVPGDRRLVLSAHSGGGDRLAGTLGSDEGDAFTGSARPVEVVLLDAIHVTDKWDGVRAVLDWVRHHLQRTARALKAAKDDAARDAAVAVCPVLRAYGSSDYKTTYERLGRELGTLLGTFDLGTRDAEVKARFRVEILAGAKHEQIVRGLDADPAGGPLADALRIQGPKGDPTAASHVTGSAPPGAKAQRAIMRTPNAAYVQATTQGAAADRQAVAGALAASGYPDPAAWYARVDTRATFLGLPITASTGTVAGVHQLLLTRLQRAERALLRRFPGTTVDQLRDPQHLNVYSVSGLRLPMPASGSDGIPSLHCFGLAVDVNYAGNPFVGLQRASRDEKRFTSSRTPRAIERAMWLVHGEAFDVESSVGTDAGAAWETHDRASKALVRYLDLAKDPDGTELATLVAAAKKPAAGVNWDQPATAGWWNDLTWWRSRLKTDWDVRDLYDFHKAEHHGKAETTGYMDLSKALVEEMASAGLLWGGTYGGKKDIMHFDLQGQITR